MASENDRHEAYKNYIAANESTVLKGLENWLLFGRPIAEASILYEIRKCLNPWPAHFILENSQSRKARDGVLLENGYICKNLTIKDFLNEFSGKVFLCEGENGYDEYYTTTKSECRARTGLPTPTYASNCLQTDGQTSLTAVSRPSMKTCKMKVYSWNVCSRLLIYIQPYRLSGFIEWKK